MLYTLNFINVNKTNVMKYGRGTIFEPCLNTLYANERCQYAYIGGETRSNPLFIKTKDDDMIGTLVKKRLFLKIMESEFKKD